MSKPVDRDLVERLLADEALSYKEIARRASCSDWSVREIDREHSGGPPMKTPRVRHATSGDEFESPAGSAWAGLVVLGLLAAACLVIRARVGRLDFGSDAMP